MTDCRLSEGTAFERRRKNCALSIFSSSEHDRFNVNNVFDVGRRVFLLGALMQVLVSRTRTITQSLARHLIHQTIYDWAMERDAEYRKVEAKICFLFNYWTNIWCIIAELSMLKSEIRQSSARKATWITQSDVRQLLVPLTRAHANALKKSRRISSFWCRNNDIN